MQTARLHDLSAMQCLSAMHAIQYLFYIEQLRLIASPEDKIFSSKKIVWIALTICNSFNIFIYFYTKQ